MNLLPVVLGPERREHQVAVGQHLPESGHVSHGGAVRSNPYDVRLGLASGAALDDGAGGVGEVDAVEGLAQEDGTGGVVLGGQGRPEDEEAREQRRVHGWGC